MHLLIAITCAGVAYAQAINQTIKFVTPAYREGLRSLTPEVERDPASLIAAAQSGNAAAMVTLVVKFGRGQDGFKRDEQQARRWADQAAEGQAWEGPTELAFLYEGNAGFPRRYPLAREYYERAVKAGHVPAKTNFAIFLLRTSPKEAERATALLKESVEADDLLAATALAGLYALGAHVPRDLRQAESLFAKAAASGDVKAMRGLGLVYLQPETRNVAKAEEWWQRAAQMGDSEALLLLSGFYRGQTERPGHAELAESYLKRAEPAFRQVPAPLLYEVLLRRGGLYTMADGTRVHAKVFVLSFESPDGSVVQQSGNMMHIDSARNPTSVRLDLYRCGTQQGEPNMGRADSMVRGGDYVGAVIEMRKACGAPDPKAWLRDRAAEGHAPLLLEYADWIRTDTASEAVYLAVLAFTRLTEDVLLCKDPSARGMRMILLSRYPELSELVRKSPPEAVGILYERAAADSARLGVTGSPLYACYHGIGASVAQTKGQPFTPELIAESSWQAEREKVRSALVQSARKNAEQSKPKPEAR